MALIERTDLRRTYARTWQDDETGVLTCYAKAGVPLVLPDGEPVSAAVQRVNVPQFNGWRVTGLPIHYGVEVDGWSTLAFRQGQVAVQMLLDRAGYVHWPTRTLQPLGNAASYDTQNLSRTTQTATLPDSTAQTLEALATWIDIFPGVDLRWQANSRRLSSKIVLSQATRGNIPAPNTGTLAENWFGFRFQYNIVDAHKLLRGGVEQQDDADFDDDERWELRSLADEVLAYMPADYAYVDTVGENGHTRRRHWLKLRKRLYTDNGQTYLFVGARADELNALPDGDIVFDPTYDIAETNEDGYSQNYFGALTEHVSPTTAVYGIFYCGRYSADGNWNAQGGFIFETGLSNGDTVLTSSIAVNSNGDDAGSPQTDWYGYDVDSIADFSASDTHHLSSHAALTSASVADDFTATSGTHTSPSLNGPAQEIVDRGSFAGRMGFVWTPDLAVDEAYQSFQDYTDSAANAADLTITFTTGGSAAELSTAITGASSTPNDVASTVERQVVTSVTGTSATPDSVTASVERQISSTITGTSSTPDDVASTQAHAFGTTIAGTSATPDNVAATVERQHVANIAGTSSTPDNVTATVEQQLVTAISGTSSTPDDVAAGQETRLSTVVTGTSSTPDNVSITVECQLVSAITGTSSTPDNVASVVECQLTTAITGTSSTPDDVTASQAAVSLSTAITGTSSTPDSVAATVECQLSTSIIGTSATPDDVSASVAGTLELSTSITGTSSTPDDVTAIVECQLTSAISGTSSTPDNTAATVERTLVVSIAGSSSTPDDVTSTVECQLSTAIVGTASTPGDVLLIVKRQLTTVIVGTSTTPDDVTASLPTGIVGLVTTTITLTQPGMSFAFAQPSMAFSLSQPDMTITIEE